MQNPQTARVPGPRREPPEPPPPEGSGRAGCQIKQPPLELKGHRNLGHCSEDTRANRRACRSHPLPGDAVSDASFRTGAPAGPSLAHHAVAPPVEHNKF